MSAIDKTNINKTRILVDSERQSGFVSGGYKQLGDFRPPQQEAAAEVTNSGTGAVLYRNAHVEDGDLLYTHPAPSVPEGWQLVPKIATRDMQQTFIDMYLSSGFASAYRDMLSAAPKVSTESNLTKKGKEMLNHEQPLQMGLSQQPAGATSMLTEMCADHPYYCNESNYHSNEVGATWKTMTDFLAEFESADENMNLVFRWDIHQRDEDNQGSYYAEVFIMHQRKGIFSPHHIKHVSEDEAIRFREYLEKHWKVMRALWEPLSANVEGNRLAANEQTKEQ